MKTLRSRKFMAVVCILTAMAMLLVGCGAGKTKNAAATEAASTGEDTVKVIVCYSLSGAQANGGQFALDGVKFAADYINSNGGIASLGGAKIELAVYDATSDADQVKTVMEKAIEENPDAVAALCGSTSGLTLPAIPVCEKAEIPLLAFTNSAQLTDQGYKYIFSFTPQAPDVGQAQVDFLNWLNTEKGYDYTKVAIIYEDSSNGLATAEGYRNTATNLGLEIVYDEPFASGLADASSIVTGVINSGAHVVFFSGYDNDNKLVVENMNSMNYHPLWLGSVSWFSFGESLGDACNGFIANGNWNYRNSTVVNNPEYLEITNKFEEAYGYVMTEQSGSSFIGLQLVKDALEITGKADSVAVRNALAENTFNSMMQPGTVTFNEAGINIDAKAGVQQWQNGECVCIYPEDLASTDYIDPSDF